MGFLFGVEKMNDNENNFSPQDVLEYATLKVDLTKLNTAYVGLWVSARLRGYQFLHYQYVVRLFPRNGEMGQLKVLDSEPEHLFDNPVSENDEKEAFHKNMLFDTGRTKKESFKWYEEFMDVWNSVKY